jgi:hypothetical protein
VSPQTSFLLSFRFDQTACGAQVNMVAGAMVGPLNRVYLRQWINVAFHLFFWASISPRWEMTDHTSRRQASRNTPLCFPSTVLKFVRLSLAFFPPPLIHSALDAHASVCDIAGGNLHGCGQCVRHHFLDRGPAGSLAWCIVGDTWCRASTCGAFWRV